MLFDFDNKAKVKTHSVSLAHRSEISPEILQMSLRLIIVLIIIFILHYFLWQVGPLRTRISPHSWIVGAQLADLVLSLFAIFVLLSFKGSLQNQLEIEYPNSTHKIKILTSLLLLLIVVITYFTFKWVIQLVLFENMWIYDVLFVVIMLIPIYYIADAFISSLR